jgi:hypothetical protein
MKDWLEIVVSLSSRIGTLGFFLFVFSYCAILAEGRGATLPILVREWSDRAFAVWSAVLA